MTPHVIGVLEEDRRTHTFVLVVESGVFPAVPEGKLIPFIEPRFTRRRPALPTTDRAEAGAPASRQKG
jgi:hypothetical protein